MKKSHHLLSVAALALLFGATSVHAQSSAGTTPAGGGGATQSSAAKGDSAKSSLSKAEQNMMRDLAHANLSEIATGELALKQSQNDQVKAFAQKMIDDHTTAQKELEQLAQSKGVTLPTEPDAKHKAAMKALSVLEGEKFDKMYMAQGGVRDHKNTHQLLTKAQKSAKDPELQAHVKKVTPIVEQHLTMAQEQSGKKGSGGKSSGASGSSSGGAGSASDGSSGGSAGSGSSGSGSSPGATSSGATSSSSASPGGGAPSGSSGVSGTSGSSNSGGGSR
ncbi:MAG TPA: DUF4142 domain-containing protein [Noviherbaspirillum sp.]|jgi:putative membrane protein|uniref:DUF4142 domain-containing protein n=1 Tax=Noviherbaspirillum sp. TaxID=1926288 RepID=UPI002F945BA4